LAAELIRGANQDHDDGEPRQNPSHPTLKSMGSPLVTLATDRRF
jgi:hypothetical protein